MLVIVSDLHLADGTCGRSIPASAFRLFAKRLEELALNASWRRSGRYQPLEGVDILLLGDILDPLHSTLWLDREIGAPGFVRPWTDSAAPKFAAKVREITAAILAHNDDSLTVLRRLKQTGLRLPAASRNGKPSRWPWRVARLPVRLHYMVGNHDWYYHLPGPAFETIRETVIAALSLQNDASPFPHEAGESPALERLLDRYGVCARHGDCHDPFNFDPQKGRLASSLGDAFAVEMVNRFPVEVEKRMGAEVPAGFVASLRELTNVRPALATPLWISGQLRENKLPEAQQRKLKAIWDDLGRQFLALDFVRETDRRFKLDLVDGMKVFLSLTRRASFKTLDDIVVWLRRKKWSGEISFTQNALKEKAFLEGRAQFVVYGHTHHHEVVPLDTIPQTPHPTSQMYLNSGTWHTYHDLAIHKPRNQKFVPYQVLTYLAFFEGDESQGRRFETWSGSFSD